MLFDKKFLILTYHRVLAVSDPLRPGQTDVRMFEQHAKALASAFNVLSLDDAANRLKEGTLPSRAVVITFDDGYRDNATVALPILKKNNLTATFFVAAGFLDGGRMWNDTVIEAIRSCSRDQLDLEHLGLDCYCLKTVVGRKEAITKLLDRLKYMGVGAREECTNRIASAAGVDLPTDLMMSSGQVRMLTEQGMSVGGHTVNHPILARIELAAAKREIEEGRDRLEGITGQQVSTFAYPNGEPDTDYNKHHVGILKGLGFQVAVSTAHGCVTRYCDMLQLPRIVSWDKTRLRFSVRLLKSYFSPDAARV